MKLLRVAQSSQRDIPAKNKAETGIHNIFLEILTLAWDRLEDTLFTLGSSSNRFSADKSIFLLSIIRSSPKINNNSRSYITRKGEGSTEPQTTDQVAAAPRNSLRPRSCAETYSLYSLYMPYNSGLLMGGLVA